MLASFAMALRYSFAMAKEAGLIERAIAATLDRGLRTRDIISEGTSVIGTAAMGDAVLTEMARLA
jgi:3-isopropylmalate dehydrogenase